jgi:hypothetical protein
MHKPDGSALSVPVRQDPVEVRCKASRPATGLRSCLRTAAPIVAALFWATASRAENFEAVSSRVSNGYARTRLPDGSFQTETYVLREGGFLSGEIEDATIDKMSFRDVEQAIDGPLANRRYMKAADTRTANLVIAVYWGTSRAPAERAPGMIAAQKTESLAPARWLAQHPGDGFRDRGPYAFQAKGNAFSQEMIGDEDATLMGYDWAGDPELTTYRYFVVLLAYDLQEFKKSKRERLLWQTRFSISQHHYQFDRQLPQMALVASRYFGQDSGGLRHNAVPEGSVEIGTVKSLGPVDLPDFAVLDPDGTHVAYIRSVDSSLRLVIVDVDQPERMATAKVPSTGSLPINLSWTEGGHVRVTMSSNESLNYDVDGRRRNTDGPGLGPVPVTMAASELATVLKAASGKFSHRKVSVLGSDSQSHRYLLSVSGGAGLTRLFVLDQPNDLLFEVGRSGSAP